MVSVGVVTGQHVSGLGVVQSREFRRSGVKFKGRLQSRPNVMAGGDRRVGEQMKVQAGKEGAMTELTG